jgi:hypothetical protein
MTRKDYVLIASVLRSHVERAENAVKLTGDATALQALIAFTESLTSELKRDNPNFKKDTFLKASGFNN